jgi:hypothetical protein
LLKSVASARLRRRQCSPTHGKNKQTPRTRQTSRVSSPPVQRHGLTASSTRSSSSARSAGRAESMKSSVELRRYSVSSRSSSNGPSCAEIAAMVSSGVASCGVVGRPSLTGVLPGPRAVFAQMQP